MAKSHLALFLVVWLQCRSSSLACFLSRCQVSFSEESSASSGRKWLVNAWLFSCLFFLKCRGWRWHIVRTRITLMEIPQVTLLHRTLHTPGRPLGPAIYQIVNWLTIRLSSADRSQNCVQPWRSRVISLNASFMLLTTGRQKGNLSIDDDNVYLRYMSHSRLVRRTVSFI